MLRVHGQVGQYSELQMAESAIGYFNALAQHHGTRREGPLRCSVAATADYVSIHLNGDLAASHSVLDPARSDRSLAATSIASPSPTSSE